MGKISQGSSWRFKVRFLVNSPLLVLTLIGSISLQQLCADDVHLDSTDQYSYASTRSGLYVNTPESLFYIPGFSLLYEAIALGSDALIASFLDNIDVYVLLGTMLLKGITPLTLNEAFDNVDAANRILTTYSVACISLFIYLYIFSRSSVEMTALRPHSRALTPQFNEFNNDLQITSVYTGNAIFDRQVRINLVTPKPVSKSDSLTPLYDTEPSFAGTLHLNSASPPMKHKQHQGYTRSLLSLAPTPFSFSGSLDPHTTSGLILHALKQLDGSQGDQVFLGKSPAGELYLLIYLGASRDYHKIWLATGDITFYADQQCDPDAIEQAMEPLSFLFSEAGSRIFSNAVRCFFADGCEEGQLTSQYSEEPDPYQNQTGAGRGFIPGGLTHWIYETPDQPLQGISRTLTGKQVSLQTFGCIPGGRRCQAGLLWATRNGQLPDVIRVAEGEAVKHLHRHLKKQENPGQELALNYPYTLIHPRTFQACILIAWGTASANPIRPLLKKLHRKALAAVARPLMFTSVPAPTTELAYSGLKAVSQQLVRAGPLSPVKETNRQQAMANLNAQLFYGDMYNGGVFALLNSFLPGQHYVLKACSHLYGDMFETSQWLPDQQRGLFWLAYGVTQMDKPSIQMILELNRHGHFIQLSPQLVKTLKGFIKPRKVTSIKTKIKSRSASQKTLQESTQKSHWRNMLNEAYRDAHDQSHTTRNDKGDALDNIPKVWKDEEFLNALTMVEKDNSWQAPSKSGALHKHEQQKQQVASQPSRRRRFFSRFIPGINSKPQQTGPTSVSRSPVIYDREASKSALAKSGLSVQWLNKAMTEIENYSWGELKECCLVKQQAVNWKGVEYPLYHKSRGEKIVQNEGNTASIFFIIKDDQVVILAGGRHPKATRQNRAPWSQYDIYWSRPDFIDSRLKTGGRYTLPKDSRN